MKSNARVESQPSVRPSPLRVIASALALAFCSACSGPEKASDDALPLEAPLASRHRPKKHRVMFSGFEFEPGARASSAGVARDAAQRCEGALQRDTRFVWVDALDVQMAPEELRDFLYDYSVQGVLVVDGERIVGVQLHATSPRMEHPVATVEAACEPMSPRWPAMERLGLDALTAQVSERLLERAWSTGVIDMAERQLVVGGSAATGIALGEELVVRKIQRTRSERSLQGWLDVPTVEVASLRVEGYVGTTPATSGALCRLMGGTFGGFDLADLIVTLPDDAR